MQKNILLVYPLDRELTSQPEVPPLGLAYLASFIKKEMNSDYKITIWDLNLYALNIEEFRNKLLELEEKPDIIGIGGIVTVFKNFLCLSKICKEVFPESILLAGGSLASTIPHLLFEFSPVDICVEGEGEFTLLEIIKNIERGAEKMDLQTIKGITLWDEENKRLTRTPQRLEAYNLDGIGFPAYDLLNIEEYAVNGIKNLKLSGNSFPKEVLASDNLHMAIITSRGCTNRCTFCYRQFHKIRMNSAEFIKNHIILLNKEYGINVFTFIDELFNVSEKRMNELCLCLADIKEEIPNFYFRIAAARVDTINVDFLRRLKKAGCFQITFGLESGSQRMLKEIHKMTTVEENRSAVIATREAGILCVPQFVIGLPGENRHSLRETINFIKSIDFWNNLAIHNANAYPGSEIYCYAQDKGLINDEFAYVSSLGATDQYPLQLAEISQKEMWAIVRNFFIMRKIRLTFRNNNFFKAMFILMVWFTKKIMNKTKEKVLK